jgi:alpha-mannosidase/mannosylglycerate hydrolase
MRRSQRRVPMTVTHHVTLRRGGDRIEVRTEVDNTVRDHRLRVLLPSGAAATTYLADAPFDVIERPIALRPDNERYKELEVETKPQQSWTAVFDKQRGLALITAGLPESAVRDVPERPIALTLLRSFAKTPFTGHSEEGGQIQGRHEFMYWIVPLAGEPDAGRLCRLGQDLSAGVRAVQVEHTDWARPGLAGDEPGHLPPTQSLLEIDSPHAVLTAVHHPDAQGGPIVRLFNPMAKQTRAAIRYTGRLIEVHRTDLQGHPLESVHVDGGRFTIEMKPRQIVSLRIGEPTSP